MFGEFVTGTASSQTAVDSEVILSCPSQFFGLISPVPTVDSYHFVQVDIEVNYHNTFKIWKKLKEGSANLQ